MALVFILTLLLVCGGLYVVTCKSVFDAPGVFILHSLFLMVPPAVLHMAGFDLGGGYYDSIVADRALLQMSVIMLIGFVGVICGYLLFRRFPVGRFLFPDFHYVRSDFLSVVGVVVLSLISLGVLFVPLSMTGFDVVATADLVRHEFFFTGAAALKQFQFFANFIAGALLVHFLKQRHEGADVRRGRIVFVGVLFVLNLLASVVLGGKTMIVFPLAFTLLAYQVCVVRRGLMCMLLSVFVIVALIVGLQFARTSFVQEQDKPIGAQAYTGLYFVLYDSTLVYLDTDDDLHETSFGEDFINGVAAIVPRVIWPEKPDANLTLGSRFKSQITQGAGQGGWPVYGFAQWYVNFGWLGVVVGGLLTGWILAVLQARYYDYREHVFSFMILLNAVFLILGPWPGGVHSFVLSHYILFIVPLFLFKGLTRRGLIK